MLKLQCFIGWVVQQFCFLFLFLQFILFIDLILVISKEQELDSLVPRKMPKVKVISLNEFL